MKKLLITENPQARNFSQNLYPRIIVSRKETIGMDISTISDVWLDGNKTDVLNRFTSAESLRYSEKPLDFSGDIDTIRSATKLMVEYKIPVIAPVIKKPEDDFITMGVQNDLPSSSTPPPDLESSEIPMYEQIAILNPLLYGKRIGAGTIAELTHQLTDLCYSNGLFVRDKITGLFKSIFARRSLISEYQAQTIFETHFVDKLSIKTDTYKTDKETGAQIKNVNYKRINRADLELLWRNIKMYSVFNSRRVFYDSIPAWDNEPRIMTFMKKYFECDANPNFFLLLMTSIIGKIDDPQKNYCRYFFDIVSKSKGVGKSWITRRLLGGKYCGFLSMKQNRDYFLVDAYDGNNIIIVDDECTWLGKGYDKMSYEEFKSFVTNPTDKFSRKYQQPEEHDRCFILIRTCNDVNTVYSTNERRQIIFQSNLQEQECRIAKLPDSFFEQMLAEAKAYYEKNGMYVLTDDDWKDVYATNKENYNYETEENFTILDYARDVRAEPEKWSCKLTAAKFGTERWGNYKKYCEWCDAHRKRPMISRAFWRNVTALSELPEHYMTVLSEQKYELAEGGKARVFRVDAINKITEEDKELLDIPY